MRQMMPTNRKELATSVVPCAEHCRVCGEAIPKGAGRYRREDGSVCLGCSPRRPGMDARHDFSFSVL